MTIGSIPLHETNLGDINIKTEAILGSGLLINPTACQENLNLLLRCTRC